MKKILESRNWEIVDRFEDFTKRFLGKLKSRPNVELVGYYSSSKTKTRFKCLVCRVEFIEKPANVLLRDCCPVCNIVFYTYITENMKIGVTNNLARRMRELKTKCAFYRESNSRQESYTLEQRWLRGIKWKKKKS